ncbi:acid protease [Dichomitus squalens LYAD-421 SS1]|uniref:acid protease n=1 Tax=Dichomitus squalens (strain LYAD-421) TaxID=732165 RepID=UPI0004411072|nr:acid protease [Dichomitus squalens LYAD-421 SS1]EJF65327.1 acid protease [Dichomitus squalens LYAD-421 SS1]
MKFLTPSLLLYLSFLLNDVPKTQAIHLPIQGRIGGFGHGGLARRASVTGTPDLSNQGNLQYQTNITVNGQQFQVLIDTGSSDLYVVGNVNGAKDTGKTGSVTYAIGSTKGPIKTATVEFEGFKIPNQAFIQQSVDSEHTEGGGIIGLGPSSASEIRGALGNSGGDPVLDRIFKQNTNTSNYITILLGRAGDPTDTFAGDITVGETVSPFDNVTSQPKLPVTEMSNRGGQHWTAMLDKNGIIGPDGNRINTTKHATGNKLTVMFDSGFTFPQVSANIANQIYGRVPGAVLANVSGGSAPMWTLPCSTELNVTFNFQNVSFPIHPLDTVTSALQGPPDSSGKPTCVGAFQPITTNIQGFDIILGMSFLRNAYMLINFGDFVDGSLAKVGDPYIQLLPLTDPAEAHADFVKIRMDGIDKSADLHLLPALPDSGDDGSSRDDRSSQDTLHKYLPYIIAGSVAVGVIILILIIAASYRASTKRKYRRLHDPAPAGLPASNSDPFQNYQPTRRY